MAVRIWLGARRTRLIRQLLTESILLGLAGGLLGVIAARWEVRALLLLAPRSLARGVETAMDVRVLAFAVGLSVLTGVVFGIAPAFIGSRAGLRTNDRSNIGGGTRLRSWLVGAEIAVSVILWVGALLLFRSVVGLQSVNPGIDARNVLTFRASIPAARYPELPSRTRFFANALEQIAQIPGVRSASAVSYLPFDGMAAATYVGIGGRPPARPGEELLATIRTVMPGYFRTMGIPLIAGRDFTPADNDRTAPVRFIVNQAFVRKYLPNEDPLSTRINSLMDRENPFGEIVGVVGDVKEGSIEKEPSPTLYYNHAHLVYTAMTFVVRANGNPLAITEPARRIIRGLDASQPIADVRTMESIVDETFSRQRFSALLLSGFSISALLLAAIGIYGVLAYSVTERTREIGVRVALGAQPGQIMGMIMGKGARLVIGGTAVGIAGALALTGLLRRLLFGVEPRDIGTFLTVPAILIAVALAAAYLPARRAARLNAMDALRTE